MKRYKFMLLAAILATAAASYGGTQVGASGRAAQMSAVDPTRQGAVYNLDPQHTQVVFSVERFGFSRVVGFFDDVAGEVVLDQAHPERSTVRASIPIASLDTGNSERDGFLRGPFWLKAEQFPTIEFQSTEVRRTGDGSAEVTGNLTLGGITLPASMTVTLNKQGIDPHTKKDSAGFSATGRLSRSAFGIRTAPPIGDEVRFSIEAFALAPPPRPDNRM